MNPRPMLFAIILAASANAHASVAVSDTVSGDLADIVPFDVFVDPVTGSQIAPFPVPNFLTYGDFATYFLNALGAPGTDVVGDGVNEGTSWVFDFTSDPGYAAFVASADPLTTALLSLVVMTSGDPFAVTDQFAVAGFDGWIRTIDQTPEDLGGGLVRYTVDLLAGGPDLAAFWAVFDGSGAAGPGGILPYGPGMVPAEYQDDASVVSARLDLVRGGSVALPEPAAWLLVTCGLLAALCATPSRRA